MSLFFLVFVVRQLGLHDDVEAYASQFSMFQTDIDNTFFSEIMIIS